MRLFFLVIIVWSSQIHALSCGVSEEMQNQSNEKYSESITVNIRERNSSLFVNISLPKDVEGKTFKSVELLSGNLNKPRFRAPLSVLEDAAEFLTWYETDTVHVRSDYILASFGNYLKGECPIYVLKAVSSVEI